MLQKVEYAKIILGLDCSVFFRHFRLAKYDFPNWQERTLNQ